MAAKVRREGNYIQIFDRFRRKYILLTPEEWVRQHFAEFLTTQFEVPASRMLIESEIKYAEVSKRPDIAVIDNGRGAWLVIECKAPSVPMNEAVWQQVITYASVLQPKYVGVTNGLEHFYFEYQPELKKFVSINTLPCYA